MKILIVNTYPLDHQGGAEISLRFHVDNRPSGISIEQCLPDNSPDLSRFNGIILANIRPHGGVGERAEVNWAEHWFKRLQKYSGWAIKSEHDIHPCAHRDARCISAEPILKMPCDCSTIIPEAFERLYNSCDAVLFRSPAHQEVIQQLVNVQVRRYIIAPPIDFSVFRSTVSFEKRKKAALIIGDAIRVSSQAEERARQNGYPVEYVEYHSLAYDEMPKLLNQYQAVVLDPVMYHAFGRLAAEALACGCRVLASNRVGAFSWPDPLKACKESNDLFWSMIGDVNKQSKTRFFSRIRKLITVMR